MHLNRTAVAALLAAALAVPLATPASAAVRAGCRSATSESTTTFVESQKYEVGSVTGAINGGIFIAYDDQAPPIDPEVDKPNIVISTRRGDIYLWVYSNSQARANGGWDRTFQTLWAEGTGEYAGQSIDLTIAGSLDPSRKHPGDYTITGRICPASRG